MVSVAYGVAFLTLSRDRGVWDGVDSIEVTVDTIMAVYSNSIGFIRVLFRNLRCNQDLSSSDVVIAQRNCMRLWVSKRLRRWDLRHT